MTRARGAHGRTRRPNLLTINAAFDGKRHNPPPANRHRPAKPPPYGRRATPRTCGSPKVKRRHDSIAKPAEAIAAAVSREQ